MGLPNPMSSINRVVTQAEVSRLATSLTWRPNPTVVSLASPKPCEVRPVGFGGLGAALRRAVVPVSRGLESFETVGTVEGHGSRLSQPVLDHLKVVLGEEANRTVGVNLRLALVEGE